MPVPLQVAYKPISKPEIGVNNYQGFMRGKSEVIKKGSNPYDARPLESDIRLDHDVEIKVRDGCRLYVDIYRPADAKEDEKLPAVISWSCYGKKYSALHMLPICVWNCCVPKESLSGLEKFEGLDPVTWCPRGYAIVSVDSRGTGNSDGSIPIMGSQDAEDCYDVIEAIAAMPWSNGKVGMAGNSALAIIQWHVASLRPPHLAAIAPWEGSGDIYREQFCRGGVFSMSNFDLITHFIIKSNTVGGGIEDFAEMYRRSPVANAYWSDKRVDMTKIDVPVFISGSDFSSIHTMGSVRGWLEVPHDKKWIRWSSYQEWYELYCVKHSDQELHKYFERFLKGIENDWEKTPKVRWSALQFGDREAIDDIEYTDYPIPGTDFKEFHLSNSGLQENPISEDTVIAYNSEDAKSIAEFNWTFPQKGRLIGLPKAVLYMSCPSHDDMNVFVILRKRSKEGKLLMHLCFPFSAIPEHIKRIDDIPEKEQASLNLHLGSVGVLRASHRKFDPERSIHPQFPFHPHDVEEKIPAGEIVKLEIGIWSMGVDFDEGETLSVQISGSYPSIAEFTAFSKPRPEEEKNKGEHRIHCGPQTPSRVILPFVPL
ncbi:alpha/beta-hydrolase [Aaosphaeria arxii CBS 175.79]|uniref:Alpha/beta-hydrolase n=1 Tax=Aaosphaeria arxii CBS 175.79 TaxID=1450172 RepID=A0A6A5YBI6_9PLEO|nr:alpha/beta-hydrolase [Aaosphaeria arxii CBS 175.79]KAF2022407.1 alpha/beta-hydrolase [Aaosphaeria arxii CBS 175.79]